MFLQESCRRCGGRMIRDFDGATCFLCGRPSQAPTAAPNAALNGRRYDWKADAHLPAIRAELAALPPGTPRQRHYRAIGERYDLSLSSVQRIVQRDREASR